MGQAKSRQALLSGPSRLCLAGFLLRLRTDNLSDAFVDDTLSKRRSVSEVSTRLAALKLAGLVCVKKKCFTKSVGGFVASLAFFPQGEASSGDFAWLADGRVDHTQKKSHPVPGLFKCFKRGGDS